MDEYHLLPMLRLLQQFYLLGAGDFYLEFISRVDYGFLTAPAEVSNGWLQEEFNNCVHRTSLEADQSPEVLDFYSASRGAPY